MGLKMEALWPSGDSNNDVDILRTAGIGVAVGNALFLMRKGGCGSYHYI